MNKVLDKKALIGGILLLISARLWLIPISMTGATTSLTNIIADPGAALFAAAVAIAGVTLMTRKRIIAVIGLVILAVYYAYALFTNPDTFANLSWVKDVCRLAAIVLAAVCIFFADNDGVIFQILRGLAIAFVVIWWFFTYLPNVAEDIYTSMDTLEAVIAIIGDDLFMIGLGLAAASTFEACDEVEEAVEE